MPAGPLPGRHRRDLLCRLPPRVSTRTRLARARARRAGGLVPHQRHLPRARRATVVDGLAVTPCARGVANTAGNTACTRCSIGRFQASTGQMSCTMCPAGTRGTPGADRASASHCTSCGKGSYSSVGSTACAAREPGRHSDAHTAAACQACDASDTQYQDQAGQSACKTCPAASFRPTGSRVQCTPKQTCAPGTRETSAGSATADRTCTRCSGAAEFQDRPGQRSCKMCEAGAYRATTASCVVCPPGHECPHGTAKAPCAPARTPAPAGSRRARRARRVTTRPCLPNRCIACGPGTKDRSTRNQSRPRTAPAAARAATRPEAAPRARSARRGVQQHNHRSRVHHVHRRPHSTRTRPGRRRARRASAGPTAPAPPPASRARPVTRATAAPCRRAAARRAIRTRRGGTRARRATRRRSSGRMPVAPPAWPRGCACPARSRSRRATRPRTHSARRVQPASTRASRTRRAVTRVAPAYQPKPGRSSCRPQSDCDPGEAVRRNGTATTDRTCDQCVATGADPSFSTSRNAPACTACASLPCDGGAPRVGWRQHGRLLHHVPARQVHRRQVVRGLRAGRILDRRERRGLHRVPGRTRTSSRPRPRSASRRRGVRPARSPLTPAPRRWTEHAATVPPVAPAPATARTRVTSARADVTAWVRRAQSARRATGV